MASCAREDENHQEKADRCAQEGSWRNRISRLKSEIGYFSQILWEYLATTSYTAPDAPDGMIITGGTR
jgi:GMP synthase-like glutamine amidotransferase